MTHFSVPAAFVACATLAIAQDPSTVAANVEESSRRWFAACLAGDAVAMDALEAADFTVTDGAEFWQKSRPRTQTLNRRKPDRTWTTDQVLVRVYGDTAILTSRRVWTINTGERTRRRVTEVWRRDSSGWRIIAAHASEVP
jgi:ketosteroid isomerase-like protein